MSRLTPVVALVSALAAGTAAAQDFSVQYLEGVVEVQRGAAWHQVAVGDSLPAAAVLRLDDDAVAELAGGGSTLRITRRGTYELAGLARASAQNRSAGVGAFLSQRARAIKATRGPVPTKEVSAAGARASEQGARGAGAVTWVGGETADELLAAGIDKLAAGAYSDAATLFQDALDAASGPEADRAAFYLGYAAYLRGDLGTALRNLEKPGPDPASPVYDDHVLVLGQALVDTFAYADAAELLRGYLGSGRASGENLQAAHLFLGLSEKGLGNKAGAAESLREAQRLNAGSDAGRAAARLLETL